VNTPKSLIILMGLMGGLAQAHEFRPAQVQVDIEPPQVTWVAEADRLAGHRPVLLLEGCTVQAQTLEPGTQQILRVRYACPTPPTALVIEQLPADLKVIATRGDRTVVLDATSPRFVFAGTPPASWWTFVPIGIEHILLGFDHLLFVLAFILLVTQPRRLALALTGFTLGHSLTLAAATLGWVHVPGPPVEAVIALSVVFLAAEAARGASDDRNERRRVVARSAERAADTARGASDDRNERRRVVARSAERAADTARGASDDRNERRRVVARSAERAADTARGRPSLTSQHPGLVAITFGLLHGLGFAGALAELLPQAKGVLAPLVGFNLGVELGQITFVIAVLVAVAQARRFAPGALARHGFGPGLRRLVAWGIGTFAGFWVWDRVAALVG
jgi:hypothetical protein